MTDTRYKTFWRRFGAMFLDGLILRPLTVVSPDVRPGSPMGLVAFAAVLSLAGVAYGTIMHAKLGATVGKMAAGVIVLDNEVERIPTWRQALKRDILNYGMVAGAFILEAMVARMNTETERLGVIVFGLGIAFAMLGVLLAELLSALTNPRRRSVHDLIAGTVVVKTSFYSDDAVRQMRGLTKKQANASAEQPPRPSGTGW